MAKKEIPTIQLILGKNIKKVRNDLGLSQQKLAELSEVSTNYIGEIEIARKFPSANTLQKISYAVGLKPYQLFFDDEEWKNFDKYQELLSIKHKLKLAIDKDIENIIKEHFIESSKPNS
ncbi:MAG: helix-turn-helix domain-containing protein [Spirochaetia bacterium]|nr:helix-turn-helix domain-containing protein [Spirochaetia bacterium]MCF7945894.1 helix-turn-helix domain-containing protein [Spirochaetia bacterium]